jgi:hypothetical protein
MTARVEPLFQEEASAALGVRVFAHLQSMWERFHPYADDQFVAELRRAVAGLHANPRRGPGRIAAYAGFHRRYWEMYVGCALSEQGVELIPREDWDGAWNGAGPDLMARVESRRVWVECIAPGGGDPDTPDAVPDVGDCPINDLPDDQIKLRFLFAVDTKRKQLKEKWGQIVKPGDAFVVAINSRCIPLGFVTDGPLLPGIVSTVYGLGNYSAAYDPSTKSWSNEMLTRRRDIVKSNSASVDADLFGSGRAKELSGILYSPVSASDVTGPDLASHLLFVHNRTATVRLPDRWLPRSPSYSVSVHGNTGSVTRSDPESVPA